MDNVLLRCVCKIEQLALLEVKDIRVLGLVHEVHEQLQGSTALGEIDGVAGRRT